MKTPNKGFKLDYQVFINTEKAAPKGRNSIAQGNALG